MRLYPRVLLFLFSVLFCLTSLCLPVLSAEPDFTPEQLQELQEATRLNAQMGQLYQKGKVREALVPAQQALAIRMRVLGDKHPGTAQSLDNLGLLLGSIGDYVTARKYHEQALAIRIEVLGVKDRQTATSFNNLGSLLQKMRKYEEARPYLEQALAINKELLGEKHPGTAISLNNLGTLLLEMREFEAARPCYMQALAIRKEVLGKKHPDTARSLFNLGSLLQSMRDYVAARSYYEQALAIQKEVLGDKHPKTATSLNNLGTLLEETGDYAAARPYYEQALAIRKEVLGKKHPDIGASLNNMGGLLLKLGDHAAARFCCEQALSINREVLGEKHPETANSLNNLGALLQSMGEHTTARSYLEQAAQIRTEVLGPKHLDTVNSLNNLGGLLNEVGDYTAARHYYEQALAIRKEVLGEKHPDTATSLNNLGLLLQSIGDYVAARNCLEEALAIRKQVLGQKHPATATSLNNMGLLLLEMREYTGARKYLEQALAIKREVLGEKHHAIATSLSSLAGLLMEMGGFAAAGAYYEQALAIRKEVLGEKHPDTATSLNNLGGLLKEVGDYMAARPNYEQALAIQKKVLGENHPQTATFLNNLAQLEAAAENWSRSIELTNEVRHLEGAFLVKTLPGMARDEQMRFLQLGGDWRFRRSAALAIECRKDLNVAAMSAAWVINGKGTTQEALAQQTILASEASDPAIAESVKRLLATRRDLANLVMTNPKPGQAEDRQRHLAKLETEEQKLAREVGRATGRPAGDRVWIELDEVRRGIAADAVLVDLVWYQPLNFQAKLNERFWKPARYAAWLIPAVGQGEVEIVDLGPAAEIEAVVAEFRAAIQESNTQLQTDVDGVLARLSDLVYKPLAGRITAARHWLVSPDGALWSVPWAALRLDEKTYAIEKHEISYLVSSRDLLNRPARGQSSEPVVMADPDYGLSPTNAKAVAQQIMTSEQLATRGDSTRSRDMVPKRWRRLPGTASEAAAIEPQLQAFAKVSPRVFLGERALESVLKNVHSPRVLVLSTHAFFLAPQPVENAPALGREDEPRGKLSENPLLRCGIVLAGANQLADAPKDSQEDDGLLTGLEIVACDLRGTELTVLSACETGLGDVHSGQGVAGLRQAFQLAGSESVMSSLWEVPDRETAELMKAFFANLAAGQSKAVALGNAQRSRIAERRKQSGDSHPWFWAAFTMTGR